VVIGLQTEVDGMDPSISQQAAALQGTEKHATKHNYLASCSQYAAMPTDDLDNILEDLWSFGQEAVWLQPRRPFPSDLMLDLAGHRA
jgi:hypothetical protein